MIGLETDFLKLRNETFDPFDNDYIYFKVILGDNQVSEGRNAGYFIFEDDDDYQLDYCSEQQYEDLVP